MSTDPRPHHDAALAASARAFALELTRWPSVTGTPDEARFARRLHARLSDLPPFRERPEDLLLAPIPGDPLGRANVIAHLRGHGAGTVILSGHFDTVPVDDYGELAPLAGEAEALRAALIRRLEGLGEHPQALVDLKGDFLPGRGLLDMKAGLAAGLAVLARMTEDPQRMGHVVLVATPDEEDRSAGMRAAAALLPGFLRERGLEPRLCINLDAISDNADGASGRVVAYGCIGKLLLSALVIGKESHAAYPFDGVNAGYLAAEIAAEMEVAPELAEAEGEELAAPPALLGLRDLKPAYNVTLPGAVWATWNVLIHRRSAGEVLEAASLVVHRAAERARMRVLERAARLNRPVTPAWERVLVMTVADLMTMARRADPGFQEFINALGRALAAREDLDLQSRARELFAYAWAASGLTGPAVILGFGSMPYPANHWPAEADALRRVIDETAREVGAAHGVGIGALNYFPAIADMSFLGPVDADSLAEAAHQTPIWGSSIPWDLSQGATPGWPIVNIGPWGRDYHHWLERLHAPYAFDVLPAILRAVVARVLADADPSPPA